MMELILTRVFDVILYPNMAYMVITCALFSFGLAGIYLSLRPLKASANINKFLVIISALFGITALMILPTLNFLPFDYTKLAVHPVVQIFSFLGMYLALTIPFFLSGLIFITVFSAYSEKIQFLYFCDLTGAAVGCVIMVPFIPRIGPGGLLFCALSLTLFASAMFAKNKKWSIISLSSALIILLIPFVHHGYYDFHEHLNKRGVKDARISGKIEKTYWDPISKIDVVDLGSKKHIAYDGGSQSSHIYPFDGDYLKLRQEMPRNVMENFWFRGVLASHYLKRDSNQKVLIIGSGGGQETKAALMYGAAHVDAVELVKYVVKLGKNDYSQYNGNIFNNPKVHVQEGEGRSFLRAEKKKYDIIQIFSNQTSSSIAAGSGAIDRTYLQTSDAYMEYFEHLNKNGILHINHHIYPREVTTAALAWKEMGRKNFQKHVVVFERTSKKDNLPTLLIKMTPWTAAEVKELKHFFSIPGDDTENWKYKLVENPLDPDKSFLSRVFYSGTLPAELVAKIPFRIIACTDNKPYFNYLRKKIGLLQPDRKVFLNSHTASVLNSQMKKFIPMDSINLIVTSFVSLFFAVLFIILPLNFSEVGKSSWHRKKYALIYFSCLGAGFIIFELVFIQIFMKLIGYPLYTYSTVVFALLFAAGSGSFFSRKFKINLVERWTLPFVGILFTGIILRLIYSYVFGVFLAFSTPVRILVSFFLIFPLGFFLGMPFPLGILAIEKQPKGAIAWCWGLNGLFTIIGGILSVVFSIYLGFNQTLYFAIGLYVIAFFTFSRIRQPVPSRI